MVKVKVIPRQAEVAQGVPGRLRPRIFLTFGTTRVVGRQPYAPVAFTPGEIPGTHFQGLTYIRMAFKLHEVRRMGCRY